jgi:hypothetical protein
LIWVGNIIFFAIVNNLVGDREFAFPRPEGQAVNLPLNFLDHVFLSFTTGTAFGPTDMSPLTTRANIYDGRSVNLLADARNRGCPCD